MRVVALDRLPTAAVGTGKCGQIDSQSLPTVVQRTCGKSALVNGREKLIGLADKQRVSFRRGDTVFVPFTAGGVQPAQTIEV